MEDFVHTNNEEPAEEKNDSAKPQTSHTEKPSKPDLDFLNLHPFVKQTVIDRVRGCIVGSALGDAIGLYTEFLPKSACETVYPSRRFSLEQPVTEWYQDNHRNRFEPCAWTDDTDQALLILLAFLTSRDTSNLPQEFASRLQIWIEQGLLALSRPPCGIGRLVGSVVSRPDYLQDPVGVATTYWIKSSRHVAPNGSLMRTHPIGVIALGLSEDEGWAIAAAVGRTTHVDPRCTVSCCISVGLIRGILRGEIQDEEDMNAAIERAYTFVLSRRNLLNPGLDPEITELEITRHLDRMEFELHVYAEDFDTLKLDSATQMGYVYKCLGSSLLSLRKAIRASRIKLLPSSILLENLMTDLIMEGGDADTNGAVAGALLGAWFGYANLPPHWSRGLAHKGWLDSKIERLICAIDISGEPRTVEDDEAPDGGKGLMSREELEKRDHDMLYGMLQKNKERLEREERRRNKNQPSRLSGWFKK